MRAPYRGLRDDEGTTAQARATTAVRMGLAHHVLRRASIPGAASRPFEELVLETIASGDEHGVAAALDSLNSPDDSGPTTRPGVAHLIGKALATLADRLEGEPGEWTPLLARGWRLAATLEIDHAAVERIRTLAGRASESVVAWLATDPAPSAVATLLETADGICATTVAARIRTPDPALLEALPLEALAMNPHLNDAAAAWVQWRVGRHGRASVREERVLADWNARGLVLDPDVVRALTNVQGANNHPASRLLLHVKTLTADQLAEILDGYLLEEPARWRPGWDAAVAHPAMTLDRLAESFERAEGEVANAIARAAGRTDRWRTEPAVWEMVLEAGYDGDRLNIMGRLDAPRRARLAEQIPAIAVSTLRAWLRRLDRPLTAGEAEVLMHTPDEETRRQVMAALGRGRAGPSRSSP